MKIDKTKIMGYVSIFLIVMCVDLIREIRIRYCRAKLWRNYNQGKYDNLKIETTIRKIQRRCNKSSSTYNYLCWLLASIALMKDDEELFLVELNQVSVDMRYAMKSFAFALYFRAKQNYSVARTYYQTYFNSRGRSWETDMVMIALFSGEEVLPIEQCVKIPTKKTKNPAVQKLYHLNNIVIDEQL